MLSFLSGGGRMGAAIRAHNWAATPLGPPTEWPAPLKALVSVLLDANQPMFLAWGPEQIMVYNDPYAAILANKHPAALGRPFLEVWSEVAHDLRPIVDQAYRGEPVHMDDITLWMERRGYREEAHFSFSYTPIRDGGGEVQGFFCPCTEITAQVMADRALEQQAERQQRLFEQAPGFIAVLSEPDHRFEFANEAYRRLIGGRDPVGQPVREALPELEGQQFFALLDRVFLTGERHVAHQTPVTLETSPGRLEVRFLDFVYEPVRNEAGVTTGIFVEGHDVTEAHRAREAMRESEERLRMVIDNAQDYAILTTDPERRVTSWSEGARLTFGYTAEEILGKSADILFTVEDRHAGEPARETERAAREGCGPDIRWHRRKDGSRVFVSGSMRPLLDAEGRNTGYLKIARDETSRREAETRLRESEARLRALTDNLPSGMVYQLATGRDGSERRFLFVSQSHEKLTGVPADAVLADPTIPYNLIVPAHRAVLVEAEAAAIRDRSPFDVQVQFRRADGETRWCRIISAPRESNDGSLIWDGIQIDITDQRQAQEALQRLNETLEAQVAERTAERDRMWQTSPDLMLVIGFDGIFRRVNPAWTATLGYQAEELIGHHVNDFVIPDDHGETVQAYEAAAQGQQPRMVNRYRHKDGSIRFISWAAAPAGDVTYATGRDITAERERQAELELTQEQLRQAQKMEAVGQLTGGIAHDFNNLLTGVIGSLDMMQRRIANAEYDKVQRYASTAMTAANRAAALTHRLLAFARRQPLDPRPVDANRLVTGMNELLRRTLGESIELNIAPAENLWRTLCDPHQLESAILNLAINARDAMPGGGQLTIETCNARLDSAYAARQRDVKPGQYVCICVTDTGTGMTPDVIAKAFDPFFTTKPIGQGTGLGLSTIYGFAQQSEGYAKIYSEVGTGTTVKLYLPRFHGAAEQVDAERSELTDAYRTQNGEVVLVVEDEEAVRSLVVDVLQELGYRVIEASDGPTGLEILESDLHVDLLISDVGLPGLNGRQLADLARKHRPQLKVLFMTGYAENAAIASGFLDPGMEMITKPFAVDAFATRVRKIIEERSAKTVQPV